jgi:predicted RNA-binding Zn-ribbon protein involved in translation (DUF1610 family)
VPDDLRIESRKDLTVMKAKGKKRRELRFVCPECGSEDTLSAEYRSWVEVERIYADGGYDGPTFHNDIVTFSCGECGYDLTDEKGNKVYEDGLAEWVSKNCPQE